MRKTGTYSLNQWDPSDRILMEDFNGDNAKLDAALAALAKQAAGKAEQSALAEETAARESADSTEATTRANADSAEQAARIAADNAEKTAREAAVAALNGAVALCGDLRLSVTTFTGTGSNEGGTPTIINFSKLPLFYIVQGGSGLMIGCGQSPTATLVAAGSNSAGSLQVTTAWNGTQLRMTNSGGWPSFHLDEKGIVYHVFSIYREEA